MGRSGSLQVAAGKVSTLLPTTAVEWPPARINPLGTWAPEYVQYFIEFTMHKCFNYSLWKDMKYSFNCKWIITIEAF